MYNRKAQSILEYLIILTTILAAILVTGKGIYSNAINAGYDDGKKLLTGSTGNVLKGIRGY